MKISLQLPRVINYPRRSLDYNLYILTHIHTYTLIYIYLMYIESLVFIIFVSYISHHEPPSNLTIRTIEVWTRLRKGISEDQWNHKYNNLFRRDIFSRLYCLSWIFYFSFSLFVERNERYKRKSLHCWCMRILCGFVTRWNLITDVTNIILSMICETQASI